MVDIRPSVTGGYVWPFSARVAVVLLGPLGSRVVLSYICLSLCVVLAALGPRLGALWVPFGSPFLVTWPLVVRFFLPRASMAALALELCLFALPDPW